MREYVEWVGATVLRSLEAAASQQPVAMPCDASDVPSPSIAPSLSFLSLLSFFPRLSFFLSHPTAALSVSQSVSLDGDIIAEKSHLTDFLTELFKLSAVFAEGRKYAVKDKSW